MHDSLAPTNSLARIARSRVRRVASACRLPHPGRLVLLLLILVGVLAVAPTTASANITVSGFAYEGQGSGTIYSGCGTGTPISLAFWGTDQANVACSAADGSWSFTVAAGSADRSIVVWFDGVAVKGATYLRNLDTTTNITGVYLNTDYVRIHRGTGNSASDITETQINTFDSNSGTSPAGGDADIPINYNGTLVSTSGTTEVLIRSTATFAPTVGVTATSMEIQGTFTPANSTTIKLTGSGTGGCTAAVGSQMPLCFNGGVISGGSLTTWEFAGTGDSKIACSANYGTLNLYPASGTPTYSFGDSLGCAATVYGGINVGDATHTVVLDMGADANADITFSTFYGPIDLMIGAGSTLQGDGSGIITVSGSISGTGTITMTGGTVRQRVNVDTETIGTTSGAANWQFNNLTFSNYDTVANHTIKSAAGGTGWIKVLDLLTVGKDTDTKRTTFDFNTNDRNLDIALDLTITSMGTLSATSDTTSTDFTIARKFTLTAGGVFTPNGGAVTFDDVDYVAEVIGGPTFYTLMVNTALKIIRLEAGTTVTVNGTGAGKGLQLDGGSSCNSLVTLTSTTDNSQALLVASGANTVVDYVAIGDIQANTTALTATNSVNDGGNSGGAGWTINNTCSTITVYGSAKTDEGHGTGWSFCDGSTLNISMSINGRRKRIRPCASGSGDFNFANSIVSSGATIVVYLDSAGGHKGATYTIAKDSTSDIGAGADPLLYVDKDYVRVRAEATSSIPDQNNSRISKYDYSNDTDIPIDSTSKSYHWGVYRFDAVVSAGVELRVDAGKSFNADGNVTTPSLDVEGTFTMAGITLLTLSGSGAGGCTTGPPTERPLCIGGSGTFDAGLLSATAFTGTSNLVVAAATYNKLSLVPPSGSPTYTLGATLNTTSDFAIGDGANAVTVSTETNSTTISMEVGVLGTYGDLTVNASATLTNGLTGSGSITTGGSFIGAGTVTTTDSVTLNGHQTTLLGTTSGANDWRLGDVTMTNTSVTANRTIAAWSGTGLLRVGSLTIGDAANTYTTTYDVNGADRIVDDDGDLTITSKGSLVASNSATLTIGGSFTRSGTFTHSNGTVIIDDGADNLDSVFSYSAATTFYNLQIPSTSFPWKAVRFDTTYATNINGALSVTGASCADRAWIHSDLYGTRATINLANATPTFTLADLRDMNFTGVAPTASNSSDSGNNAGVTINAGSCTGAAAFYTISGTANADEAPTKWTKCDGITLNIAISIDTAAPILTPCNPSDGTFLITVSGMVADKLVVLYFRDTTGSDKAVTYTRSPNPIGSIASIAVTKGRTRIRSESATNITNTAIGTFDNSNAPKIPVEATSGSLTEAFATKVVVDSGKTFVPGNNVTVTALEVIGTYTGGAFTTTLTGSGTGTTCTADTGTVMPLCGAGTYTAPTTTTFTGTSNSPGVAIQGRTYNTLEIKPAVNNANYTLGAAASQTITATALTIGNGANTVTADVGTWSPTINVNSAGALTVASLATLSGAGTSTITATGNITGAGTITLSGTTLLEQRIGAAQNFGSTVANGNNWTFNDLTFSDSAGSAFTSTFNSTGNGQIIVNGTLTVGRAATDTQAVTLDDNANNRIIDANNVVINTTRGILKAPPSASFTIAGNFTNNNGAGGFVHDGGTVTFDGAGTSILSYSAETTFSTMRIETPSKVMQFDNVYRTSVVGTGVGKGFIVNGGACGTLVTLSSEVGGDQFDLNVTGLNTSVQNAKIKDSNAVVAITATLSEREGTNTTLWTIQTGACSSLTLTVPTGSTETLNPDPVLPGVDASNQSTINIVTNSAAGYELKANDTSDTTGMTRGGGGTITDWTGPDGGPTPWVQGRNDAIGYFGVTVLSASSTLGRLDKWRSAGCVATCTETDWANNLYIGLDNTTSSTLHSTTTGTNTTNDNIVVAYRLDAAPTNPAGTYTTTVTYTGTTIA